MLDEQEKISETQKSTGLPISSFTDEAHDTTFHFQILQLKDQVRISAAPIKHSTMNFTLIVSRPCLDSSTFG